MTKLPKLPKLIIALIAVIALPVMADQVSTDHHHPTAAPNITYTLDWDWGQAQPSEGGGWRAANNLGYQIKVERGYLVNRSVELVACSQASQSDETTSALRPAASRRATL